VISQFYTPGQRRLLAWREATAEVWRTWGELRHAPRETRPFAFLRHLDALEAEGAAAAALAAHHALRTGTAAAPEHELAA
jgi:hypothetical protein